MHKEKSFEMCICLWPDLVAFRCLHIIRRVLKFHLLVTESLTALGCLHIIRRVLKCRFSCDREFCGLEVLTHNKKGFEMSICLWQRVWRP